MGSGGPRHCDPQALCPGSKRKELGSGGGALCMYTWGLSRQAGSACSVKVTFVDILPCSVRSRSCPPPTPPALGHLSYGHLPCTVVAARPVGSFCFCAYSSSSPHLCPRLGICCLFVFLISSWTKILIGGSLVSSVIIAQVDEAILQREPAKMKSPEQRWTLGFLLKSFPFFLVQSAPEVCHFDCPWAESLPVLS